MERIGEQLKLTVWGQPKGAGSKTAEARGKRFNEARDADGRLLLFYRHATKGTAEWMQMVEKQARIAWRGRPPLTGALWLELDCYEVRPDGHFRSVEGQRVLRPDAPAYPDTTRTHDSGKLRRAIEDSLTNGEVLSDDKRVVDGHDRKHYGAEAKAVVRVGFMVAQIVDDLGIATPPPPGQAQLIAA